MQAVGAIPLGHDITDGVRQVCDRPDGIGHVEDARFRQGQPIEEGRGDAGFAGIFEVEGIGGENVVLVGDDIAGHADKGCMLALGRCRGERAAGSTGLAADHRHQFLDFFLSRIVKHERHSSPHPSPAFRMLSSPYRPDAPWRRVRHSRE